MIVLVDLCGQSKRPPGGGSAAASTACHSYGAYRLWTPR